ncbi:MAG: response regulator [Balneolaceae bacterium]
MKKIKVLVTDDHDILRYGLVTFLEKKADDIQVVGEASNGEECLEIFKKKRADLCILDIEMPRKNGIETTRALHEIDPDVKILILSMHIEPEILNEVLEAGIDGYILKNTEKTDLVHSIRSIMKGQQVFSEPVSKIITRKFLQKESRDDPSLDGVNLTNREVEILNLIVDGYTSQEIAEKLYISPRTVDTHRANLMQKLELNNTAALVRFAIEHKLV